MFCVWNLFLLLSGEVDYMFLEQVVKKFNNVYFTSLEVSTENISIFKSIVARGNIKGVTWEWKPVTWDNFQFYNAKSREPKLFHFIFSVHSLIYISDVEKAVMNMYETLHYGGVLLMIVASGKT